MSFELFVLFRIYAFFLVKLKSNSGKLHWGRSNMSTSVRCRIQCLLYILYVSKIHVVSRCLQWVENISFILKKKIKLDRFHIWCKHRLYHTHMQPQKQCILTPLFPARPHVWPQQTEDWMWAVLHLSATLEWHMETRLPGCLWWQ